MKAQFKLITVSLTLIITGLLFMTSCNKDDESETLTDSDGNVYSVGIINDQIWMTKNLRTGSYSDGSGILELLYDDIEWASAGPALTIYQSDIEALNTESKMITAYGVLYNWYAVTDNSGLCPTGWRVPTESDWDELIAFLGGEEAAGGKLKSTRTDPDAHPRWESPNTGATDSYKFAALPAGFRTSIGDFLDLGYGTYFWSSSEYDSNFGVCYYISYDGTYAEKYYKRKRSGYPVRCIKE